MDSPWHFGNTTVRDPLRIREGLVVLRNTLNGNIIGKPQERFLAYELDRAGVIEITNKRRDCSDMGRKWRSCLIQLGFITHKFKRDLKSGKKKPNILEMMNNPLEDSLTDYAYEITPSGCRMINAKTFQEQQECILRALLAYEIPSIMESGNNKESFTPFIFILQVLQKLSSFGITEGLSRVEMGIVQIYDDHNCVDEVIEKILKFREERNMVTGRAAKRRVDNKLMERIAAAVTLKKKDLLKDYADLNFRYVWSTGLFSLKKKRLIFMEWKMPIIKVLINDVQKVNVNDNGKTYLRRLWKGAELPTDTEVMVRKEIVRLHKLLLNSSIDGTLIPAFPNTHEISSLNQVRIRLEILYQQVLEKNYAMNQYEDEQVKEIIAYLKKLDRQSIDQETYDLDIEDEPAYLEWAVWRAFLAINHLINEPYQARRFKVDQDFFPLGRSSEGGPDMIFEFEDYVLIVEVTLASSSCEEAVEGDPVRRYVAKERTKGKPVYGLFLGRFIDVNTVEAFRIGIWYTDDQPKFINIVPITLKQFILIMEKYLIDRFDNNVFRRALDHCLIPRNYNASVWKKEIQKVVGNFIAPCRKEL